MKATISIAGINKLTITSVREGDGNLKLILNLG